MFDFLKGKSAELTLALDRADGVYRPGDVIGVIIEVRPDQDLRLRAGRVRLSGTEHFEVRSQVNTTDADGNNQLSYSYSWERDEFYAEEAEFLGETTLPGGTPERFTFQARLPADALPSCLGEILRVEWLVQVKLDRPLAGDLEARAVVRVPALARGGEAPPAEYGVSGEPNEAELALVLPGLEAVAGQPFAGQLRILPRKDFAVTEVRLELERNENVPLDQGYQHSKAYRVKLAGGTRLKAGQPHVIPFEAPLPPDAAPSLETAHGTLAWTMKGILARRLRRDTSVAQAFTVFTERAA